MIFTPEQTELFIQGFANQLFTEGDYYRAITEYKRGLYVCDDDSTAQFLHLRIGQSLFLAEQYNLVLEWHSALGHASEFPQETLLYGRSLFRLERFREASDVLDSMHFDTTSTDLRSQAHFYAGISYTRLEQPDDALNNFRRISSESVFANRAANYIDILEQHSDYNRKNPLIAGLLGVVPGAGYAYTEHYGTALASLALNGLLSWATIDAFQDGDTAAGITYSIFATGFYIGNITGSVQSADRYNEYQSRLFQAQFSE
jgi:tetratricopeptide (TPR) repeat protein